MSSPDRIIGVAVIDETTKPYGLLVLCHATSKDGRKLFGRIPVVARGVVKTGPEWEYEQLAGQILRVRPSLLMSVGEGAEKRELFHNDGVWEVRYEINDGRHTDKWETAWDQFMEVNRREGYLEKGESVY